MSINVKIGKVENLNLYGADPALIAELQRGVSPEVLEDLGHHNVPATVDQEEPPTEEEQATIDRRIGDDITQEAVDATTRVDNLRNLAYHADRARSLEGLQTSHERAPKNPADASRQRHIEKVLSEESLAKACAVCVHNKNCGLKENLDAWLDVHPYKNDDPRRKFATRPGSRPVKQTESRSGLLKVIDIDPQAHCDPAKRG